MRRLALALTLILAACKPTAPPAGSIEVRDAWARETAPGQASGAVYLTIVNSGSTGDKLLSVTTPKAQMAMLHGSNSTGGVMAMRMMRDLAIPGAQVVTLAPLGTHIMLTGLAAPLRPGDHLPLTLRFAHAGARQVDAVVLPAGSSGPTR